MQSGGRIQPPLVSPRVHKTPVTMGGLPTFLGRSCSSLLVTRRRRRRRRRQEKYNTQKHRAFRAPAEDKAPTCARQLTRRQYMHGPIRKEVHSTIHFLPRGDRVKCGLKDLLTPFLFLFPSSLRHHRRHRRRAPPSTLGPPPLLQSLRCRSRAQGIRRTPRESEAKFPRQGDTVRAGRTRQATERGLRGRGKKKTAA